MEKIAFDKYYTPPITAKWCIQKVKEIIGEENITEWVEPSAGCGSFSHQIKGCRAYDLYPQHEYIEQADFTKLDLGYKKGRLFIGNPPFGSSSNKLLKTFYNKCVKEGDYIAFILPASYCWNYRRHYKFEIVYSCLLWTEYSNRKLWSSFVIYKRNDAKKDWRERVRLKDVELFRFNRENPHRKEKLKKHIEYDYAFVNFGRILQETDPYKHSGCIAVKCNNDNNRGEIITFLKWLYHYEQEHKIFGKRSTSVGQLNRDDIYELLKLCIDGIE